MNNNKRNITIHVLAGVTAIAQLAAGFVLVSNNKKNIVPVADQRIESYASEETLADQSNVVIDKASDIEKASKPIMPPIGENDLIRTARNRYILNNIKDSLDEKNNSQAETIVDQSNVSFEKEANIVKGKANLPKNMNIGEPYGPWDKTNPVNEAIHQHTMDIINNNDDIKENAIVKGKVNLPPYTNIGEPYGPWDKNNPVYEAVHQHTMDIAAHNYIDENFPYIDKIHENELHAMMPNTNQPVVPPYKQNEESDEHTRSI